MIKTTILAVTILFAATMMVQEVYAPEVRDDNVVISGFTVQAIPDWVRNNFEWYVNGQIDDKTLLTSMSWLVDNRLMFLSEKAALEEQAMRNEINDLKQELEEVTIAAIAIPNLIEARKGANESTASTGYLKIGEIKGEVDTSTGDLIIPFTLALPNTDPQENKDVIAVLTKFDAATEELYGNYNFLLEVSGVSDKDHTAWIIAENTVLPTQVTKTGEIYTDEYGRIKAQFPFDEANKEEIARFTVEIYSEKVARTQSSNTVWIPMIEDEVLVSFENGDPDKPIIIGRVYNSETMPSYKLPDGKMISGIQSNTVPGSDTSGTNYGVYGTASGSGDRPTEEVAFYYNKISFASDTVDDIMTKGGTTSVWEDGIATFSDMGYKYIPPYTTGGTVDDIKGLMDPGMHAMNIVIEKESQIIDTELKIVEQWLDIIAEKQAITSTTTSDRLATAPTEEYTVNYNESDLEFISRILESSDQKIKSLQTGLTVLEQKLQTVGDDAQLANIDLQNSLQKQQQMLQMLSNISKTHHDSMMSIIRNMSG